MSTKPRNGRRLKLIGATALGLDALLFLGGAVVVAAVEGFDATIFVPLVVMCILGFFGWLGLRSPGRAAGCLVPLAFLGFCFWALGAALGGVSLAWFLLFLILWSFIPFIAAILFLIARRVERPSQRRAATRSRALPHRSEQTAVDPVRSRRRRKGRGRLVLGVAALGTTAIVLALGVHHFGSGGCAVQFSAGGASWSPNGNTLAFARRSATGSHIYTLDLGTRRLSQLTHSRCGNEIAPAWSPTGQRLAYERSKGQRGIYIARPDGGGERRVIAGDWGAPAWAPDGKRLAFLAGGKLYVVGLHGGGATWLKTGPYVVDRPAWSPDGTSIAFGAYLRGDVLDTALSVRLVAVHGGPVRAVVGDGDEPAWSPDGRSLVYEIYSDFHAPTQVRIASRSGAHRLVHNLPEGDAIPAWSPDGRTIAIVSYPLADEGGTEVVYLVRPDGTGFRRIYRGRAK